MEPCQRTIPYRVTPGEYVGRIMTMWLSRWWYLLAMPFVACCVLALWRWEWIVVGLMLLFLVYPAVVAYSYFRYGLIPATSPVISWTDVRVGDNAIEIESLAPIPDCNDDVAVQFCVIDVKKLNFDNVLRVSDSGRDIVIRLKSPRYAHICIPRRAFGNNDVISPLKTAITDLLRQNGIKFA